MDIEYKGGNCVVISIKKNNVVVDPKLSELGLKDQAAHATVQLATQPQFAVSGDDDSLIINQPGEYEVANISIRGIAARAHMDGPDAPKKATMYTINAEDTTIAVVGHIYPDLGEEQLEALGVIDVLVVPVGGNGYTLDATGAVEIIRKVDPKMVIPTHYADPAISYPVSQADVDVFLKELGAVVEVTNKLRLKPGMLGDVLTVQHLNRVA